MAFSHVPFFASFRIACRIRIDSFLLLYGLTTFHASPTPIPVQVKRSAFILYNKLKIFYFISLSFAVSSDNCDGRRGGVVPGMDVPDEHTNRPRP